MKEGSSKFDMSRRNGNAPHPEAGVSLVPREEPWEAKPEEKKIVKETPEKIREKKALKLVEELGKMALHLAKLLQEEKQLAPGEKLSKEKDADFREVYRVIDVILTDYYKLVGESEKRLKDKFPFAEVYAASLEGKQIKATVGDYNDFLRYYDYEPESAKVIQDVDGNENAA